MKCIDNELIQKYIDGETSSRETDFVEKHISGCPECARRTEEQKIFVADVKKNIRLSGKVPVDIPAFMAPVAKKTDARDKVRRLIYAASAAACAAAIIFWTMPEKAKDEENILLIYNFEGEYDANRTVSEQEMIIRVIDSDGNVSEI